jgi:hypothetical protein
MEKAKEKLENNKEDVETEVFNFDVQRAQAAGQVLEEKVRGAFAEFAEEVAEMGRKRIVFGPGQFFFNISGSVGVCPEGRVHILLACTPCNGYTVLHSTDSLERHVEGSNRR